MRDTTATATAELALTPGVPYPLGATWDGTGTNFALYSEHATAVTLCLFDADGTEQQCRLPEVTAHVWHGYIPGIGPGQRYGYRVAGPFAPHDGQRFNPHKLLLDPYAKALAGAVEWDEAVFGYPLGDAEGDVQLDARDSAARVPQGVVIDPAFAWGDDTSPRIPLHQSVIYEAHVKGFTARHPAIAPDLRGTYAGLATPPAITHLRELGITAIELMPIHAFVDDKYLRDQRLRNYWGYNTINYFAPEARYAAAGDGGGQVTEFKAMVKALHAAGIEVLLDVVYNHTAEGNHLGPTLSYRGIDNAVYYRLVADAPRYYMDYTGTGNTLNVPHPQVLQLVMDSLRYWVQEMHVDGFRFDLAAALARGLHEVDKLSAFFDVIHQDPVLSQVKLIAEPWDIGEGGYQVGNFPILWAEWNGKYRDTVRAFWTGGDVGVAELAYRLTGSSDLYQHDGRRPYASINFVTAHDGFTLADLVSYNAKHNEANGEDNRDGADDNQSWNHGTEGPTDDPQILAARDQTQRNLLATLLLSQGVPMLLHGDELGRTQQGNNNAYCQDNPLTWIDWDLDARDWALLRFTQRLVALRHAHPNFRRPKFFQDRPIRAETSGDLRWFRPDGTEMGDEEWEHDWVRTIGLWLEGEQLPAVDPDGTPVTDDAFFLLCNGYHAPVPFRLPSAATIRARGDARRIDPGGAAGNWVVVLDTAQPEEASAACPLAPGTVYDLQGRALVLLRWQAHEAAPTDRS